MFFFRSVSVIPRMPDRIARLGEISKNLWFSWNQQAENLFSYINDDLWREVGHNPVKFLIHINPEELERITGDSHFLAEYDWVVSEFDRYMNSISWFEESYPQYNNKAIAYFCAEFGFHESLPIYSGGLGILAGEHIKSASDQGLPMVGVGLLYKQGYFTQQIDFNGEQHAHYPNYNFREMPITPVTCENGSNLVVNVDFKDRLVYLKVWKVQVGRVSVYFLDADVTKNSEEDRKLTARLYGGDDENRIQQEIILGMGGVKALRAVGVKPMAYHLNEGHAAFSGLERLRELVQSGICASGARESIISNTLFTTHTPVLAGHDVFSYELVDKYLGHIYSQVGMTRNSFLNLGRDEEQGGFNMTFFALHLSSFSNGVSKIHGRVSKDMFHSLYPHLSVDETPIYSITNGIHVKTWVSQELSDLFTTYLKPDWEENMTDKDMWNNVYSIPDEKLWKKHQDCKESLVQFIRDKLQERICRSKEEENHIKEIQDYFRSDVLTIGFARRFTTYKRADLILRDKDRLARLMNDPKRPVQIMFSGKAHPDDEQGQNLIKEIYNISNEEPFKGKIVFIEDYDIDTARYMLQGVDVWLNNPRWPKEASGTSGMKAAANGVLHCSVPDGWWPEGFNGENGFIIGNTGDEGMNKIEQDTKDAEHIYHLLEKVIIPSFYNIDSEGIPGQWLHWMKNSIATLPVYFNTTRMVQEYTNRFYSSLLDRGIRLSSNNYVVADNIKNFKLYIEENWHQVAVNYVHSNGRTEMQQGEELKIEAGVNLGPINPRDVVAEITYGEVESNGLKNVMAVSMEMKGQDDAGHYHYSISVPLEEQGNIGYTVRVRPYNPEFAHQYELPLVAWAPDF
ncbi:MAG: alpha-glucan family phosphorylase [Clostridiales bacterium]|nr:alpha-glucan family phosphorylase [Clostridiales bacterium]MCF8023654.1 alpha-glucan family phosphorylase [Clostridiales bacterium]